MLKLFKKSNQPPPPEDFIYQSLKCDLHSHLIPGIDDGAPDMEKSLELVRSLIRLGFQKAITTPHIMADSYPNTPAIILSGLEQLREAVQAAGLEFELEAAAEYYVDDNFAEQMEKQELLTFGGKRRFLLFEMSYTDRPLSLDTIIFQLQTLGYTPVLAHPERYQFFWEGDGVKEIEKLREKGALLQVNLTSLAGTRGKRASGIARDLIREELVDFLGTDLHRMEQVPALSRAWQVSRELREVLESGILKNRRL